jgi:hypothetical protein
MATMDARLTATMELASRPFSLIKKLGELSGLQQTMTAWGIAMGSVPMPSLLPIPLMQAAARARNTAAAANYWSSEMR